MRSLCWLVLCRKPLWLLGGELSTRPQDAHGGHGTHGAGVVEEVRGRAEAAFSLRSGRLLDSGPRQPRPLL